MNLKLKRFNFLNEPKHIIIYDAGGNEIIRICIDKQIEFKQPILKGGTTWQLMNIIADNFDIMWNIIPDDRDFRDR